MKNKVIHLVIVCIPLFWAVDSRAQFFGDKDVGKTICSNPNIQTCPASERIIIDWLDKAFKCKPSIVFLSEQLVLASARQGHSTLEEYAANANPAFQMRYRAHGLTAYLKKFEAHFPVEVTQGSHSTDRTQLLETALDCVEIYNGARNSGLITDEIEGAALAVARTEFAAQYPK